MSGEASASGIGNRRAVLAAALILMLIAAAWLRLRGIGFGLPALNDPDELIFEMGAVRMLREHTLNPGWFGHPATTTMYALAVLNVATYLVSHLAGWTTDVKHFADAIYADPGLVILPGRMLMLVFGLLSIFLTWRLGRLLFGPAAGLAAAGLLAVNPVHVIYSQIIRSDMLACVFMLLCLHVAVTIAREGKRRDYVKAAIWLALAIATKWPFAAVGIAVAGAGVLRLIRHPQARAATIRNLALFALCTPIALFLVSPFLLLDYPTVLANLNGEAQLHHLGATGGTALANAGWYLRFPLRAAFGIAGLLLVAAGLVTTARNREIRAVIAPVLIGFLLLIASQNLVWERWILPLMAPLSIVAGAALVRMAVFLRTRLGTAPGTAAALIVALVIVVPLVGDVLANARERMNDTRQIASRWAVRAIPAGSTILLEHFAFDLEAQPWTFLFPLGTAGCVDARSFISGKAEYAAIDKLRGGRSNLDFGTTPPAKLSSCRADYAIVTQYDRYRAERDRFPAEYANYRRLLAAGTLVATFRPTRGVRGGPVVRIIRFDRRDESAPPAPTGVAF